MAPAGELLADAAEGGDVREDGGMVPVQSAASTMGTPDLRTRQRSGSLRTSKLLRSPRTATPGRMPNQQRPSRTSSPGRYTKRHAGEHAGHAGRERHENI